jgi:hypothetical protein
MIIGWSALMLLTAWNITEIIASLDITGITIFVIISISRFVPNWLELTVVKRATWPGLFSKMTGFIFMRCGLISQTQILKTSLQFYGLSSPEPKCLSIFQEVLSSGKRYPQAS